MCQKREVYSSLDSGATASTTLDYFNFGTASRMEPALAGQLKYERGLKLKAERSQVRTRRKNCRKAEKCN
jgi:hypothetical protein